MSKQFAIKLLRTFYPEIEFNANPKFAQVPSAQKKKEPEIAIEVYTGDPKEDKKAPLVVRMSIELKWPDLEVSPYTKARIVCVGVFQLNHSMSTKVYEKHKMISAPSMLYSGTREFIKILTNEGPWDPIYIPAIQFGLPALAKMNESQNMLVDNSTE